MAISRRRDPYFFGWPGGANRTCSNGGRCWRPYGDRVQNGAGINSGEKWTDRVRRGRPDDFRRNVFNGICGHTVSGGRAYGACRACGYGRRNDRNDGYCGHIRKETYKRGAGAFGVWCGYSSGVRRNVFNGDCGGTVRIRWAWGRCRVGAYGGRACWIYGDCGRYGATAYGGFGWFNCLRRRNHACGGRALYHGTSGDPAWSGRSARTNSNGGACGRHFGVWRGSRCIGAFIVSWCGGACGVWRGVGSRERGRGIRINGITDYFRGASGLVGIWRFWCDCYFGIRRRNDCICWRCCIGRGRCWCGGVGFRSVGTCGSSGGSCVCAACY